MGSRISLVVGSIAVTMVGVTGCQGDSSSGGPTVTVSVTASGPSLTPGGTPTVSLAPTVTPPPISPRPSPPAPTPTGSTPSLPAPGERISLTLRDHGRAYAVRLSTRIRLVLPDDLIWTMPKGDLLDVQQVMSDAPMGVKEWEIRPTGTGRTTLTTTGTEISRDPRTGPPVCAPPSPSCHEYRVTLDIS